MSLLRNKQFISASRLKKELDEKVVELHFPALGAELTVLTQEQAD